MKDWQDRMEASGGSHIGRRAMDIYVAGGMDERERERVEAHLSVCDRCLSVYMEALDAGAAPAERPSGRQGRGAVYAADSAMPDIDGIAKRVIGMLEAERPSGGALPKSKRERRGRARWLQHPAAHFAAAAAITLLLIGTGALGGLSERLAIIDHGSVRYFEPQAGRSLEEGWSERMLHRTVSWLDGIEAERFN
ncbi:zf-HC2 domain-containing protein [Paenibacillus thailandensis]|uniref:Anti-sigma-W factor RsiW n=1 Tax=Paenibacillus thailandensis TaxID=393250 RepID=A0ABW5R1R5_9BACL